MNKLGAFYGSWNAEGNVDLFHYMRKAATAGFDVIELMADTVEGMDKQRRKNLKKLGDELGIAFTFAVDPPSEFDVSSPDAGTRRKAVEKLSGYFHIISEFDSHIAAGIGNGIWNSKMTNSKEEHTKWSIESMQRLMPLAEELKINCCLEVVNRYEHYMLNTCREAVEYIRQVSSNNLKVQLDTFHMNVEEDNFGSAIMEAGSLLGYFHVGENNRRPPGVGFLPWKEIFGALNKINYDGIITMEVFVKPGGDFGDACSVWRDIMPGADMDAEITKSRLFLERMIREV